MADSRTSLEPDKFYHIYNHAVGNERLFKSDSNYRFFLKKLKENLQNYIDIYAYCLMPNHYHLLVKIIPETDILENSRITEKNKKVSVDFVPNLLSRKFGNVFNSYAQAYNKQNNRKGSLFYNRYKREHISTEAYLRKIIVYLHLNPVAAEIATKPEEWTFSSYNSILSKSSTLLKRKEVIELFDDIDNFKYCHLKP